MGSPTPRLLVPHHEDKTTVRLWIPGKKTDSQGNVITDPRASSQTFDGWDVQKPFPSPGILAISGSAPNPKIHVAYAPVDAWAWLKPGMVLKDESTGLEFIYQDGTNWGTHLQLTLERTT